MAVERAPKVRRFAPPANGAKRGVRLEWEGKKAEIDVPVLPFQTIETINEPRKQLTLFSAPDDARPAFPPGWRNKLIWGDNKLAMAALAEQYTGQVDLIYIDPPFDTGDDFSVEVKIGTEEITKEPSIIERHAYLDTWGRDGKLDSYLQWFYETVLLMHTLLSETGSLYVHLDWHVGHYGKVILDEVFGDTNFQSEIIREKSNPKNYTKLGYGNVHDVILFYSKTDRCRWNKPYSQRDNAKIIADFPNVDAQGRRYKTAPLHAPGIRRGETGQPWHNLMPPSGNHWRYVHATLEELDGAGDIEWSSTGNPRERIYADESAGVFMQDIWLGLKDVKGEYPSMKNSEVVDRIVGASSSPNDLVLDCFIGSGTTALAAERLGRRWIACDLVQDQTRLCVRM